MKLSRRAVLADAPAFVGYGIEIDIGHPPLSQAVIADLHKAVLELIGLQKLNEPLLQLPVSPDQIDRLGPAQHPHSVFRWQEPLRLAFLLDQKFKRPGALRHLLESQVSFE